MACCPSRFFSSNKSAAIRALNLAVQKRNTSVTEFKFQCRYVYIFSQCTVHYSAKRHWCMINSFFQLSFVLWLLLQLALVVLVDSFGLSCNMKLKVVLEQTIPNALNFFLVFITSFRLTIFIYFLNIINNFLSFTFQFLLEIKLNNLLSSHQNQLLHHILNNSSYILCFKYFKYN